MANSCSITCNVTDRNTGKVKVSTLWKELASLFKTDRLKALSYYFITKDGNFLRENSDVLEFDTDGEVTIMSLKKAMETGGEFNDLTDDIVLTKLQDEIEKELGRNKLDYDTALDNALKFNRSSQYKNGFMATIQRQEDGRYSINVVKRTSDAEYAFADQVKNKILTDAVRLLLQQHGLSVRFMEDSRYAARYSTNDVRTDIEGLKCVASILQGENSSESIAEVAGHFLVGAMIDHPLVQRLINTLTPDVQKALLGRGNNSQSYIPDFIISESSAREAAGILVGHQLLNMAKNEKSSADKAFIGIGKLSKAIKSLLQKIGRFVQRIFGKYDPHDIRKLEQEARDLASTVAEGYLNNPEMADVTQALNEKKTIERGRLSKHLSKEAQDCLDVYNTMVGRLRTTVEQMESMKGRFAHSSGKALYKKLKYLTSEVNSEYRYKTLLPAFSQMASVEGMFVMLKGVTQLLETDIKDLLDSVNPADRVDAYKNIVPNARNIRAANIAIKNIAELYSWMLKQMEDLKVNTEVTVEDENQMLIQSNLEGALKQLGEVLEGREEVYNDAQQNTKEHSVYGIVRLLEAKRRIVFIDAFKDFLGADFIERNAGVIWGYDGKGRRKLMRSDRIKGYSKKTVEDLIDTLEEDISLFDRYLGSASDCSDFVTAVGEKTVRAAMRYRDNMCAQYWDSLEELRLQMIDAFGSADFTDLFEYIVDENGNKNKTGNFLSEVNYGQWENDRMEFKKQLREEFNEYLYQLKQKAYDAGNTFELSDKEASLLYHNFVDEKWKRWHSQHSKKTHTDRGDVWMPNNESAPGKVNYHNEQWDRMFDLRNPGLSAEERAAMKKRLVWYRKFIEFKAGMDKQHLPAGATSVWRVPQFEGRFSHKFRNLKQQYGNNLSAFGNALARQAQLLYTVKQDEAWAFGSDNEFNVIEEDPLGNEAEFEKEKINRLPLYGIEKLKDMSLLSTDVFGSMLRYATMATTYNAMENLVDIFEIGRDVLLKRNVRGNRSEKNGENTRAYKRYLKWLEKSVYGINVEPPSWDEKGHWRKFASAVSSFGGKILLGGNIHGGFVNTGTGTIEMLKEAFAGENFTTAELAEAMKMYFVDNNILDTMWGGIVNKQRPEDLNSLWIRHWNILSENFDFYSNQKFDTRAMSLLDNRLWEWYNHTIMLPYSSGDHFMQTVPYFAMGIHQKVYDRTGRQIKLIDAYEVVDGRDVFAIEAQQGDEALGRTPKKIALKEGIFKSVRDIRKYETVSHMLEKIDNYKKSHPKWKNFDPVALDFFNDQEVEILRDNNFSVPETARELLSLEEALSLKKKKLTFNEDDELAFMMKCRDICNRMHGVYNREDRSAFQQTFYGNLLLSMRGYALGMVNRRFAANHYSVPQGKNVEGNFNTLTKVLLYPMYGIAHGENWKALGEALVLCAPIGQFLLINKEYGNRLRADMKKAGFTDHQYYNIRRSAADFLAIEALTILRLLSAPGFHAGLMGDEDEDGSDKRDASDNVLAGLLYYFSSRWLIEQAAFSTIGGAWKEAGSLTDVIPAGISGTWNFISMLTLFLKTQADKIGGPDLDNSKYYYQSSREGKYEKGDEKWFKKFKSMVPGVRSWYPFFHPYESYEAFDYGRKLKGGR